MRIFICIFFITIFALQNVSAQDKTIDSLKKVLQTEKEDTNKVNTLIELNWIFAANGDYDTLLQYANATLSLSKKINFTKGSAYAYGFIGSAYYKQNNYADALKNLYKSLTLFEKIDDQAFVGIALVYIGHNYKYLGNYSEALKNYFLAIQVYKNLRDTVGLLEPFMNIGYIYFSEGKYSEAIQQYLSAEKMIKQLPDNISLDYFGYCYEHIGEVYQSEGEIAYKKGNVVAAADDFSDAEKNYSDALNAYLRIQKKEGIAACYSHLGNIYRNQKKNLQANVYLKKGLQLSTEINDKDEMKNDYHELAMLGSIQGNYKEALEYYERYILFRDSLVNEKNTQQSVQLKMQYEFDKKEDSTKAVEDKKEAVAKAEIQNQKTIRNFSYTGAVAMLSFAGVGFYRYRKRRKLQSQQEMLNERLRISRELHDDIGSTLGSISIYSEVAKNRSEKNENADEAITKIGNASRELIDKMNDIVWSVNPNNESFEQLVNRIQVFAAIMLTPYEILYNIYSDEEVKNLKLTTEERKNIYLIYKEAVHNIIKYAECSQVEIKMILSAGEFVMTIKDNGKGFDINKSNQTSESLGGNGIKNMIARAENIKAGFSIQSIKNEGTTIGLKLKV